MPNDMSLPNPLRVSLGPSLPLAKTLDELCTDATTISLLLAEIVNGVQELIRQGRPRLEVRAVAFQHIAELQRWFPEAVRNVVAMFNGHPQFDRIHDAVEEVRVCVDALGKLTYDQVRTPDDKHVVARCTEVAMLVRGAVDDLRSLAGLRPLPPGGQDSKPKGKPKGRKKRKVAEPLIAQHLMKRPHDTTQEVKDAVGCSVGVVAESPAWKLNQQRLKIAKQQDVDPKAIKLDEKAINAAGGDRMTQLHDHRRQDDAMVDELDQRGRELSQRIGEYQKDHPDATPQEVASALSCTAGDVECRQTMLSKLAAEQAEDGKEDIDVEDPDAKRGKRRKWVEKQV